ncbi:hypothetical protein D3C72_2522650 [compost metagenome]
MSVAASYWMTSQISLWAITLPGVTAMFSPTLNLLVSVWRILRSPPPAAMSSASMCMPLTRFAPWLDTVSR